MQIGWAIEKQNEFQQQLVQFYSELLHETKEDRGGDIVKITRHIPKLVTPEHNIMLMRCIERAELEEAVFRMEKGKFLASDGFTIDFF